MHFSKRSLMFLRRERGRKLGPVVRKPINVNLRSKVNQGFHLAL